MYADPLTLGHYGPQLLRQLGAISFYIQNHSDILFSKSCVTRRSWLPRHGLRMFFPRIALGTPCARVRKISSKNNNNWYIGLADFEVPNKIQFVMIWRMVMQMALCTKMLGASDGQRELERRWLERERELRREHGRLERWQSSVFPKLLFFSPASPGEFLLASLFSTRQAVGRFLPVLR